MVWLRIRIRQVIYRIMILAIFGWDILTPGSRRNTGAPVGVASGVPSSA